MAWYHVGNCSCPVGCCDCGEPDNSPIQLWWDEKHEVIFENKWTMKDYDYYKFINDTLGVKPRSWLVEWIESGKWTYLGEL